MADNITVRLTRESQDAIEYLRSLSESDDEIINEALKVLYAMLKLEERVQSQVTNDGMTVH